MTIRLIDHGMEARVLPEAGALVVSLIWVSPSGRATPLLYSPHRRAPSRTRPNLFGLWPMVPFANRAFGGVLRDREQTYDLPLNNPNERGTIHGFGWQNAWQVANKTIRSISLTHDLPPGSGGPYSYRAQMDIEILDGAARFSMKVENTGDEALPFGMGFHPWFPRMRSTKVFINAKEAVTLSDGKTPASRTSVPVDISLDGSAPLPRDKEIALSLLDVTSARIIDFVPGFAVDITSSDNLKHPVLWSPANAPFVCFEPQSHCIGAPTNAELHAHTPMVRLNKGETIEGWTVIKPSVIG